MAAPTVVDTNFSAQMEQQKVLAHSKILIQVKIVALPVD